MRSDETRFDLIHVLWYVGIVTSLAALGLYAEQVRDQLGVFRFALILIAYGIAGLGLAYWIRLRVDQKSILSGMLVAASLISITMAILKFQEAEYGPIPLSQRMTSHQYENLLSGVLDSCSDNDHGESMQGRRTYTDSCPNSIPVVASPILTAVALVVMSGVGLAVFRFVPLSVLTIVGIWYICMELLPDGTRFFILPSNALRSLYFDVAICGLATVLVGWAFDIFAKENYGFWLNKLGMWVLPLGLAGWLGESELQISLLFTANIVIVLLAIFIRRPAGGVVAIAACGAYPKHLYEVHFAHSLAFPFLVLAAGVALTALGWYLHRNSENLENVLPKWLLRLRPDERDDPITYF